MTSRTSRRVFTPPRWLNAVTSLVLRTPGLQRLVGRSTALLTFTGRRSGRVYTTPLSYARVGDRVVLTCHPSRTWWRNLGDQPAVELRLAGRARPGTARVLEGAAAADALTEFFARLPMAARAAGVSRDAEGRPAAADVTAALEETVVVAVDLAG